jgi:hypothetical protein
MYAHLMGYKRDFNSNRWHDAADVVTGIVEHEATSPRPTKITRFGFI